MIASSGGFDPRPVWDGVLSDRDRRVITNAGYGKPRGLGASPLLMVIDCQYNYIGADEAVDEQQDRWPAGGGAGAWSAVRTIDGLLRQARSGDVPIIYTRNVQKRTGRFDSFAAKSERDHTTSMDDTAGSRIVELIEPQSTDFVIDKSYASAFYGTPLLNYLIGMKVDTLVVTGVSTSGCVRATAVDAVSRGFNVAVVADAVADRIAASHQVALLDLWMKYTDVIDAEEAGIYLQSLVGTR